MLTDCRKEFQNALKAVGLSCRDHLRIDGKIHRFANNGRWRKDGWYVLNEGNGSYYGAFGDWKQGIHETWSSPKSALSPDQKVQFSEQITRERQKFEEERDKRHESIAAKSAHWWRRLKPTGDSAYLKKKKVKPFGVRFGQEGFAVPLCDSHGKLWNLQRIYPNGQKLFMEGGRKKGCFHLMETLCSLQSSDKIYVCEGFATGSSLHEVSSVPTVIAFDVGNIDPVVESLRQKWPEKKIIICGDNDQWGDQNRGKEVAEAVAQKHGCEVILPQFSDAVTQKKPTDFNDLHVLEGGDAVWRQLVGWTTLSYEDEAEEKLDQGLGEENPVVLIPPREKKWIPENRCEEGEDDGEVEDGVSSTSPTEWVCRIRQSETASDLPITSPTSPDESTFAQLALLNEIDYDRARKSAAKTLGIKIATLDKEVKKRRPKPQDDILDKAPFPVVEPWADPVSIDKILDELAATLRRFAVLPNHADTALSLWIAFSWCIESVETAPILAISSPEKQCGKTTVLTLISELSQRATQASNITPSAVFRTIEAWRPTLIIDEADTFIRASEELRGILNSGHTRSTAFVIRTVGELHEPRQFTTWGAKAIALIGKLPDTLQDRSIVIELKRKGINEKTEKFKHVDKAIFSDLRRKFLRFAKDNADILRHSRPLLPDRIADRAADNWEPLLAIAELAGGEWTSKARNAAKFLSSFDKEGPSLGVELLRDIQEIFVKKECDKISTKNLINELCLDEEKRWATFYRGKPINPHKLSKLLGGYGIASKSIRAEDDVVKGYKRSQFKDTWLNYVPASSSL